MVWISNNALCTLQPVFKEFLQTLFKDKGTFTKLAVNDVSVFGGWGGGGGEGGEGRKGMFESEFIRNQQGSPKWHEC